MVFRQPTCARARRVAGNATLANLLIAARWRLQRPTIPARPLRTACRFNARTLSLDVRYRSLPLLTEMADGFGAPRYGLRPTAGPHRFSRRATRTLGRSCFAVSPPSMSTERSRFLTTVVQILQRTARWIFRPKPCAIPFIAIIPSD